MLQKKDIMLILSLGVVLAGVMCFVNHKTKKTFSVSWNTMGTVASITGSEREHVERASIEAKSLFDDYDRLLSSWNANSELSMISANAGGRKTFAISETVTNVYKLAFDVMRQSKGAFNPLIGNVMKLWGFNGSDPIDKIPTDEEISALHFSIDDVYFNCPDIRLEKKGMSIDLGGIAKGEAIDKVSARLKNLLPDSDIIINLGGNIKILGREPKKIGIRNPFGVGYVKTIVLTNSEAVATSGNYERFVEIDGVKYSHIFDGRNGRPATNNIASTTVIAKSAAIADALSTTLYVLGPKEGIAFINKFYPDVAALWISTSKEWTLSPLMKKRLSRP